MTSSPELLRYFQSEAGEYLDTIEGLMSQGARIDDAAALIAAARALRGSATMARAPRIAELGFTLEQVGNAVRDGELVVSAALLDDLRAASVDLRILIGAASRWTDDDDRRARQRIGSLRRYVPNESIRPTPPSSAETTAPMFIALQAAAIAGDLDAFVFDPTNQTLLSDLSGRVRTIRGIAGLTDHAPLADVADAVEDRLRSRAPDAQLTENDTELLRAAAGVFRRASADLRSRGRVSLASGEIARFARASSPLVSDSGYEEVVTPIDDLFFTDGGPHLVRRGNAPESAELRFHAEVVPRAEHLRRLIADLRVALDAVSKERANRDLRVHLHRLESFARSFNAHHVASFFGGLAQRGVPFDIAALDDVEDGARVLLAVDVSLADIEERLAMLDRARHSAPSAPALTETMTVPTATAGGAASGASGHALHVLLAEGLAGLAPLDDEPLSEPAKLEEDEIIPIERLLYAGRAALQRAVEVRDAMRARDAVDDESLRELYDLLDLARAE